MVSYAEQIRARHHWISWEPCSYKDAVLPAQEQNHKDKTVSRPSYLCNMNTYTQKDGIELHPCSLKVSGMTILDLDHLSVQ